jgi:hypothetical protein
LIIVLSNQGEGDTIAYSEMFPALRALNIGVERVAEVLDDMGILVDDRVRSFEAWIERKLGSHWVCGLVGPHPASRPAGGAR